MPAGKSAVQMSVRQSIPGGSEVMRWIVAVPEARTVSVWVPPAASERVPVSDAASEAVPVSEAAPVSALASERAPVSALASVAGAGVGGSAGVSGGAGIRRGSRVCARDARPLHTPARRAVGAGYAFGLVAAIAGGEDQEQGEGAGDHPSIIPRPRPGEKASA